MVVVADAPLFADETTALDRPSDTGAFALDGANILVKLSLTKKSSAVLNSSPTVPMGAAPAGSPSS